MRKTPRGKSTDTSSQDRILEVVMSTMNNFTEKLNSMEERLIGLTSWLDTPATSQKTVSRKSHSCEKIKGTEISDDEKAPVTTELATVSEDRIVSSKTFPDVAVAIKPTPARPKKLKADPELGVAPLQKTEQVSIPGIKSLNYPLILDQYGNPVQVQSLVETAGLQLQNVYDPVKEVTVTTTDQAVYVPVHETLPVTTGTTVASTTTLEALKANPFIQQLVEERVAVLESRMKSELQQYTQYT